MRALTYAKFNCVAPADAFDIIFCHSRHVDIQARCEVGDRRTDGCPPHLPPRQEARAILSEHTVREYSITNCSL